MMKRTTDETCAHCQQDYNLQDVPCQFGQGLLHCEDHRARCAKCKETFCREMLIESDVDELLCPSCYLIENSPIVKAARRAAATGSHRDLKAYLKTRRNVA